VGAPAVIVDASSRSASPPTHTNQRQGHTLLDVIRQQPSLGHLANVARPTPEHGVRVPGAGPCGTAAVSSHAISPSDMAFLHQGRAALSDGTFDT
jgi:hypothetical protein